MFDLATSLRAIDRKAYRAERDAMLSRTIDRQKREMAAERQADPEDDADEERRRDLEEHGDET